MAAQFPVVKALPWNHFGRKNVGYLYAILHGARVSKCVSMNMLIFCTYVKMMFVSACVCNMLVKLQQLQYLYTTV
jgi:hypothetical protein